ncbi:MAG: hypothetical protein Q8M15_07380 [Bacteroidota bacterium]|nr:hypothetical protein [Bacteroidota bacterium]
MTKFVLKRKSKVGSVVNYFKLYINGKSPFAEFCDGVYKAGNYEEEIDKIEAWIDIHSEGQELPDGSIKPLGRDAKDPYKDFEFRTKHIRVYFFRDEETGDIIVLGGMNDKKEKDKNLAKMRAIKMEYFKNKSKLK